MKNRLTTNKKVKIGDTYLYITEFNKRSGVNDFGTKYKISGFVDNELENKIEIFLRLNMEKGSLISFIDPFQIKVFVHIEQYTICYSSVSEKKEYALELVHCDEIVETKKKN